MSVDESIFERFYDLLVYLVFGQCIGVGGFAVFGAYSSGVKAGD
jgi:hypothetical protein